LPASRMTCEGFGCDAPGPEHAAVKSINATAARRAGGRSNLRITTRVKHRRPARDGASSAPALQRGGSMSTPGFMIAAGSSSRLAA